MIKHYDLKCIQKLHNKLGEALCTVCVQDVEPSISPAEWHAMKNVFIRCDTHLQAKGNHFQGLLKCSKQKPNINGNTLN